MGDSLKCVYLIISTIFLLAEHKSFLLQLFSCCYVTVHCQFSKLFIKVYLFFNTQYSHNTFFLESFVYFPFLIVESMCHIGIRKETLKRNKKEKKVQQVQHQLTVISHNKFNKILTSLYNRKQQWLLLYLSFKSQQVETSFIGICCINREKPNLSIR